MLGLSLRKILTLFGAAMMIFVLMNVQFGSVAPRVIDGAEGYKLDAFLMFDPSCSFDKVEEELRTSGSSYCCLLYTSPSPRDNRTSRMPSSA